MAKPFITVGIDCSQGSDNPAWRKRRDGWEWMPVGKADPAFPAPGVLRVPEMSAAEFHRMTPEPAGPVASPSWLEKTELDKAVAYEAFRGRLPDVWTLLAIVESANPPGYLDNEGSDVTLQARDGWQVSFFYDVGDLDYIDRITTPEGLVLSPWDWPAGAPGRQVLMNWRGVGDREWLLAHEDPIRTIDCTALQGDRPVDEDEKDGITFGRIDLIGGYLDWDASVVRRTPVPAQEAA